MPLLFKYPVDYLSYFDLEKNWT